MRLPREFLTELSRSPNRPPREAPSDTAPAAVSGTDRAIPVTADRSPLAAPPKPATPAAPAGSPPATRPSREENRELWRRASAAERSRFFIASRDRLTSLEFDPDTQLTPEDRGQILAQLTQLALARPTPTSARPVSAAKAPYVGPRRLSVLDLARARKRVLDTVPGNAAPEVLRQILWAVEHGALRRFDLPMALNIALKKVREGAWSKPNRMPPNWLPAGREHAAPEQCSAA